jgi:hypothetical protein
MSFTLVFNTSVSSTFTNPVAGCTWTPVAGSGNTRYTTTDSPTTIPSFAFVGKTWSSNLTQVLNIPSNVTTIGSYAFGGFGNNNCTSLTTVTIVSNNTVLNTVQQFAFQFCDSLLSINIPGSNIFLGNTCFANCANLQTITLNSLATLQNEFVFNSSPKITSITVTNATSNYSSLNGNLYNVSQTQLIQYAVGKTATAFTIPSSVTFIGNNAFQLCSSIQTVIIPNSVTYIGSEAFSLCYSLTSINIPSNVTFIGFSAFRQCNFTSITIPASVTSIRNQVFLNCSNLRTVTVSSTQKVTTATNAFSRSNGKIPILYTTAANYPPNNLDLTNQFTNVYLLNTNYYTIQSGQTKDLSVVFLPLTSTPVAATKFLVENYGGTGLTKDLSEIFEPYTTGAQAQATNFLVENYNGSGVTKDLNLIFKPL